MKRFQQEKFDLNSDYLDLIVRMTEEDEGEATIMTGLPIDILKDIASSTSKQRRKLAQGNLLLMKPAGLERFWFDVSVAIKTQDDELLGHLTSSVSRRFT